MEPLALLCPCCGAVAQDFGPGPGRRPGAACRTCGSLERHRFLALLLRSIAGSVPDDGLVLDVAPSTQVSAAIRALAPSRYLSMDLDPDADGRLVDVTGSLTAVPLRTRSVALMVCYHVLEHIPDDAAAMREIARVLAPGGLAVIQVPHHSAVPTDEDPSAPEEERIRRFGQADHVRFYGYDFVSRLESAGLVVSEYAVKEVLPDDLIAVIGGQRWERVWICTAPGSLPPDTAGVSARILLELAGAIAAATQARTGVVTVGPVGFGSAGLVGVEAQLAERDTELGLIAMLDRYRADRAEAVAVAAGAPPSFPTYRSPAWRRAAARVLPPGVRARLRRRLRP